MSDKLQAYQERIAYYESHWSTRSYWVVTNKTTGVKVGEYARPWEVAEFNPDKVVVTKTRY